ncbi:MAG: hypothetical protein M4579_001035 [Chaenotheca gracillima]|nr:MAG: hypothetical protein M4579_001035 [Chaenotheca gracillima]
MSSRQKSFFDQVHTEKSRSYWRRHKSTNDALQAAGNSRDPPKAAAPLPISSQSRSKLKAFERAASPEQKTSKMEEPGSAKRGKENEGLEEQRQDSEHDTIKGQPVKPFQQPSSQPSKSGPIRDYPQTPATRIPLADLINNSEEPASRRKQDFTPEERVYWSHVRSPPSSDPNAPQNTPSLAAKRRAKRARSSSPISSPHDKLVGQGLQNQLNPAYYDPATELWNRYGTHAGGPNDDSIDNVPMFANLLATSSPRTHLNDLISRSGATLRRSISCGTEWPTSNAKRRRIVGPEKKQNDVFTSRAHRDVQESGTSRISRVSLLVEKIQESLLKSPQQNEAGDQSSSSPLPERSSYTKVASRQCTPEAPNEERQISPDVAESATLGPPETRAVPTDSSSEYGDFDADVLDMMMIENMPESNVKGSKAYSPDSGLDGLQFDAKPPETLDQASQLSIAQPANSDDDCSRPSNIANLPQPIVDDFDEFDDGDDEGFAADLEDVFVKYETQTEKLAEASPTGEQELRSAKEQAASEDEYSDCEDLEFELAAVASAEDMRSKAHPSTGNIPNQFSTKRDRRAIHRYLITRISEGDYTVNGSFSRPEKVCAQNNTDCGTAELRANTYYEKVLTVEDEAKLSLKSIILRQSWLDSPCTVGAFVHLIGDFTPHGQCIVDDSQNMLILHPDHLISSTVVADAFTCTRRAVLQDRVKATSQASEPQVFGHILHEVFQEALTANRWETAWLDNIIEKVVMRYIEGIYEINMGVDQAIHAIKGRMPDLQAWAKTFVSATPNPGAVVNDRNGKQSSMSINKLLEVEEHVWSPKYGLKGNIDATVQVAMSDEDGYKTLTVPFELKTGKNTTIAAHRAQTALYTILLSDRYDINVHYGILYYMGAAQVSRIPAIHHEIRHMVMKRNELACYVRQRLELPPMLKQPHMCGSCYAKVPCFVYHKLVDDGNSESSGLKEKFQEVVRHLNPTHQTFFRHWDALLTKEETDTLKFRRELWTMLSSEREKLGRCFANVTIQPGSAIEDENAPKINRFEYTFLKHQPAAGFSFVDSQITTGEPIVISDEKGHFALSNGYVSKVRKASITVAVDRRLNHARIPRKGFNATTNQVFSGIMEVVEEGAPTSSISQESLEAPMLYRLDKDEFSNGMALVRNNLIQVMSNEVSGSREIRELIVENKAPTFDAALSRDKISAVSSQANLNVDQRRALEKVMSARDYALVLGMPGTGKTTTVAHMIRALVSQNKSVLLASYTHTAVDNILLKIRDDNINILRLGTRAKIHPEVQKFAKLACDPNDSVEELRETYHGPKVVATTCLGINHPIFSERIFDYCIVDEASQITLPTCLGPIRMAKTFVLVGDHNQLPPLVQNLEARKGGLDVSLFKLLSEKHPESLVSLEHQYRMCEDVMALSNTFIYNGLLKCGNEAVATRLLSIPNIEGLKRLHLDPLQPNSSPPLPASPSACFRPVPGSCWLRDLVDPSTKVSFVNTDTLLPSSREIAKGSRIVNPVEASLCVQLVDALLSTGVDSSDIGVISVYRSQLTLLKHNMRHRPEIEMHTTDRFQGRDKEVIILSLVRSNEAQNIGDLLKDWRRLNVAFTRARTKLLIVGSKETMTDDPLLKSILAFMGSKHWVYDLPNGALEMHTFGEGATQASSLGTNLKTSPKASPSKAKRAAETHGTIFGGVAKKENISPSGKRTPLKATKAGRTSGGAVLRGRPVLQDIVNDLMM